MKIQKEACFEMECQLRLGDLQKARVQDGVIHQKKKSQGLTFGLYRTKEGMYLVHASTCSCSIYGRCRYWPISQRDQHVLRILLKAEPPTAAETRNKSFLFFFS